MPEAAGGLPGLRMFCRKRRKVCRGCECFVGSGGRFARGEGCECFVGRNGRFAGDANVLPEAAESLPEVQAVCPRRRELL